MKAGRRLPGAWLIDHDGNATDDPSALFTEPKGALLPLGGLDAGYKGFGLALLVEALTAGLSGHGRADPPEGWGGTVFVQVLDPEAFGGLAAFRRQMDYLVGAAHASKPRPGVPRVRLPGEAGVRRLREQRAQGVTLYPTIMPALAPWAAKLSVALPG
jgi:L-lactate dehydrogenase